MPITRLPATLGRSPETSDASFYALTDKKAISREQCRIYYQEPNGGRFTLQEDKFVFEGAEKRDVIPLDPNKPLPAQGFFVIECLGKNKITVGRNRVEQGQLAQLESGTPIRMSTVCLLFLLPTDAKRETMEIPNPSAKRKRAPNDNDGSDNSKRLSSVGGSGALLQELELLSAEELLAEMREAVDTGAWDRRHQLLGGLLAHHAVKDAARSKAIRKLVRENGGILRKEIMDWIGAAPKYAFWVRHTLNRVELNSFQSTVTRVLQKAGYERLGNKGRYVKWKLPTWAEEESEVSDNDVESEGAEENENDSAKASDSDVKMDDSGNEEADEDEEEQDIGGNDDSDEPDEKSAVESQGEASDDESDSSDDNEESSTRSVSSKMNGPIEEGGSDSGNDDDIGSSNDENDLASAKAGQEMGSSAESEEDDASSSGSEGGDEIMADTGEAQSTANN